MIDAVTRRRWEREDERLRVACVRSNRWFTECPSCHYVADLTTNVRDDDQMCCPFCYHVYPIPPEGDA